jgi:nucleoside phosphorylase
MFNSKKISSIIFISVLDEETQPVVKLLGLKHINTPFIFFSAFEGIYKGINLHLVQPKKDPKFQVDSIGPEISSIVTYIAIQNYHPDLVINLGTAGGVIKDNNNLKGLKLGNVCVAEREILFYDRNCPSSFSPEKKKYLVGKYEVMSLGELNNKLGLKEVSIGTSSSFISDQSNAFKMEVDVCDMESAGIAKVCFWMKVPFLAVKVISDLDSVSENDQKNMFEDNLAIVSEKLAKKISEILEVFS